MKVIVTGCHGFIGHHVSRLLIERGHEVIGVDRLNGAHSPKGDRVRALEGEHLEYVEVDLSSQPAAFGLVSTFRPDVIVHLAGQFAIRHTTPAVEQYIAGNVRAFLYVMEAARIYKVGRVVYASSIAARTGGKPSSLYGATKNFKEQAAHVYAAMGLETIGLRYGAVYGPMMRKDAGIYRVAKALRDGDAIGQMTGFRSKHELVDITDAAECTARTIDATLAERYNLFLVAADDWRADFGDVVETLAPHLGVTARYPAGFTLTPRKQAADLGSLPKIIGFTPEIRLEEGMRRLAGWMLER